MRIFTSYKPKKTLVRRHVVRDVSYRIEIKKDPHNSLLMLRVLCQGYKYLSV